MDKKINIGILGCAAIAERSVIPAILEAKDKFNLIAIASRNIDNANIFATKFNTKAVDGYNSLISDKNIDAVYIPLPNSLHAEWIEKALNNGKHVLVEKSMGCSYSEVKMLNELAQKNELVLIENFQFRFHSQLQFIINYIKQGNLGEIRCIRSSFGFPGLPSDADIRYQKDLGGGALLDAGAYPVKIAQILMGNNIDVKAANLNYTTEKDVDIWGGAYLQQNAGNLFAEIAYGFQHFYQCNIEIWGSKGKLFTNRIFTANNTHIPLIEVETANGKEIIQLKPDNHFVNMLYHFYKTIADSESRNNEYEQNINQARLIEQIKECNHAR